MLCAVEGPALNDDEIRCRREKKKKRKGEKKNRAWAGCSGKAFHLQSECPARRKKGGGGEAAFATPTGGRLAKCRAKGRVRKKKKKGGEIAHCFRFRRKAGQKATGGGKGKGKRQKRIVQPIVGCGRHGWAYREGKGGGDAGPPEMFLQQKKRGKGKEKGSTGLPVCPAAGRSA